MDNKRAGIFLLFGLLQSCMYGVGLAVHPTNIDDKTSDKPNPLGVVRLEQSVGNYQFFYEHVSSIPRTDEDAGLNMVGVNYMFGSK